MSDKKRPITVDEMASINSTDIFKVNQMRKKLGITQVFLAKCAGIPYATFNKMIHQNESIPEQYIEPLTNALIGLYYVHEGKRVVPVKEGKRTDKKSKYDEVLEFLLEIQEPKIDAKEYLFSTKEEIIQSLLDSWELKSMELMEKLLKD